jgi:hypothetical protein
VVDAGGDGVEVLDDVVDGEHAQSEALVLEAGRYLEVLGDQLVHRTILPGIDTNTCSY